MQSPVGNSREMETQKDSDQTLISTQLAEKLKDRIIHWEYPGGHRFIEEELCKEFGVSRSPVREALRVLSAKGLVEKVPYRGYSVLQPDIREIEELYKVRLALELYAVEIVTQQGFPRVDYDELHATWSSSLKDLTVEDLALKDEEFHERLASASGNKTLVRFLREINERLRVLRMMDFAMEERVAQTGEQHIEILTRISDGDAAGARRELMRNIEIGRKNVETTIKEALLSGYLKERRDRKARERWIR